MPRRFARLEPVPDPGRIEAETLARLTVGTMAWDQCEHTVGRPIA
jgi:hypothetical protein